ncbi:MAG: MFS transporter [Bacteroidaceae bacterium]|nr:MFS transporter [Bacteroidaceae bacterium]
MKEKIWNSNYMKAWSANFMLYFSFMILTPLLPLYLSEEFGASKDEIGMVLSGYAITALLIRPFSGFLVDSFPRKVVLLCCWFLFFILFGGYLLAGSLLSFFIIRTLHGAPMGATTVSNSTVAIDVLHPTRRAEGIGYYGLSNNLATAISPTVGLLIYQWWNNYQLIFAVALISAGIGFLINSTLKLKDRELQHEKRPISLDRFLLLEGWSEGIAMTCYSFSYGVISTYLAIYGKEELGITVGAGLFFALLSTGLIMSRLVGARALRQGKVTENASRGVVVSVCGYLLFAAVHNPIGYYGAALIIGLGNGHMFPAFQTMFINLAPNNKRGTANSTLLTAWDLGMGLGIIFGGFVAESWGYGTAFWVAWLVNALGVVFFLTFVRKHFLRNKLR